VQQGLAITILLFLFPSAFLNGQDRPSPDEPQNSSFSTCQVTLRGSPNYPAVITKGVVQDANGHQWTLPVVVRIPKGGKVTVTATSITPGAITALPGQINMIVNPTAGWTAVTNTSSATPGRPMEAKCREALQQTKAPSFAYEGLYLSGGCLNCFTRLIPVYSNGRIDVYMDKRSLDEAVGFRISINFGAHLYFVYRDESARQQAIASIERHRPTAQRDDKLQELKYVLMDVDYYGHGIFGVATSDGKPVPGPVLSVNSIVYLSPIGCEVGDYSLGLSQAPGYPGSDDGIIRASARGIGAETPEFIGESNSPGWSLLLGDLAPLQTKMGLRAIKVSREQTPLVYQVLLSAGEKIAGGIAANRR
jgi:hypothetical protein